MPTVLFHHASSAVGDLSIDNGMDDIQWAYGLNTATFPTYGGEVIQILSVYIDDITIVGTLSTYAQVEAVYHYFARFMQVATQGTNPNQTQGVNSYNLQPMYFTYPERNWRFKIYPLTAPKFYYGADVIAPVWQMTAHVVDDSPDLDLIKNGIKALAVSQLVNGASPDQGGFAINGQISPDQGNPDSDPFQTYDATLDQAQSQIAQLPDYYNSLLPAYLGGSFSELTAGLGSTPSLPGTSTSGGTTTPTTKVVVPPTPAAAGTPGFAFSPSLPA